MSRPVSPSLACTLTEDGIRWEPPCGRLPRPNIVRHRHVCPDGTRIETPSQWISAVGVTFDRWVVGDYLIATSTRAQHNTVPPDFAWADRPPTRRGTVRDRRSSLRDNTSD